MHTVLLFLEPFLKLIRREKLHKVGLVLILLILLGATMFSLFERDVGFIDSLWWTLVTITTVGYGDIAPVTVGGRIVGTGVMLLGIGLLAIFTATVAGVFIENRIMEDKGLRVSKVKQHFVICGWNFRGPEIVAGFRADAKSKKLPVVVIAEIQEKPLDDPDLHFIRGELDPETLEKANMAEAQAAILLSDDSLDASARDAKTILNTLTIESLYPSVYTCVELMRAKNVEHCRRAKADEIIVVGELSTNLLVQAALDHGITRMISELVSTRYGSDLYKIRVPQSMRGRTFFDIMCELKKSHGFLCVGVEDSQDKKLLANPNSEYRVGPDDRLVIIASSRPKLT
ncbi:MAG: NAD-binding protein [Deltaproteobacteria bacterium]|nr:NAD-binding protein [Deltaproteobacteria bacterium]